MAYKVIVGGCKLWNGDLFDVRLLKQGGQDLYIRMPASEEQGESEAGGKKQGRNEGMVVGIVVGSSVVISMIIIASWYMFRERLLQKILQKEDMGLPLFDLSRIIVATDNFSPINKLGEGGFGSVYKGILNDGQQIAVKRLSNSSGQGLNEFKPK
ncbi:G-type lectin S-receptor-like serine/threonine-protein kinase SD1-1 [Arachis stenosperma]|uniref:G-type lectin S-receptor-like serine/threonine-protein kinase SD1-1 n=1 Tax=Arachis stenosperma TaxID=217475 RepID=UPI0025AB6A0C|nr:G-type lectin S-receptor-like serine/threonine-protein kinase SD1-1 [Arachis stenosperma]